MSSTTADLTSPPHPMDLDTALRLVALGAPMPDAVHREVERTLVAELQGLRTDQDQMSTPSLHADVPAEPTDDQLARLRLAITDPGSFLRRDCSEPISRWSARAVIAAGWRPVAAPASAPAQVVDVETTDVETTGARR